LYTSHAACAFVPDWTESAKGSAECAVYARPAEKRLPIRSVGELESVGEKLADQPFGQADLVDLRVERARLLSPGRGQGCLYPEALVPGPHPPSRK